MAESRFVSIVVPVYNEADNIIPLLEALQAKVSSDHETLLVYDFDEDSTLPPARDLASSYPELLLVKNQHGRGALPALKTGLEEAKGDVVVVTMADLSDDVSQIDTIAQMAGGDVGVVSPSRYMRGGRQIGGPLVKRTLSRLAGLSLNLFTGIGTHDPTNNFKAYDSRLLQTIQVESGSGFELGLELTAKAYLAGWAIEEIPTTWRDRTAGESRFKVVKWLPGYLRWYLLAIAGSWSGRARRARAATAPSGSSRQPRP